MRSGRKLRIGGLLAAVAMLAGLFVSTAADAVRVRIGTLVLRADGTLSPRVLPRGSFAPIQFKGHADIETTDGSVPPALQQVRIDFDRDGKLTTTGLPICPPERLAGTTPQQARERCGGALVGTGHVEATITPPGRSRVLERGPLSLFNGPRGGGDATVMAHTQSTFPSPETHVVPITIERRRGEYRYRASFQIPAIAGGLGVLTHVDARVGRRYRAGGQERSYTSARCSDGILQAFGLVSFSNGWFLSGTLFVPCRARPGS